MTCDPAGSGTTNRERESIAANEEAMQLPTAQFGADFVLRLKLPLRATRNGADRIDDGFRLFALDVVRGIHEALLGAGPLRDKLPLEVGGEFREIGAVDHARTGGGEHDRGHARQRTRGVPFAAGRLSPTELGAEGREGIGSQGDLYGGGGDGAVAF